ncbi:MAG: MotA/TolQ/ExbB proton channel family protein [Gammaproteobacteria bacterium]|nr:MotA/TolQ/ExbB proton channel family protein [Gammaproteobacteria bacterium]
MNVLTVIVHFFQQGGVFMYPIALVLLAVVAVSAERLLFLLTAEREHRALLKALAPLMARGDLPAIDALLAASPAAIARVLEGAIDRARVDSRRSELEIATEQGLMDVLPAFESRTHYLATLSNMSTLLGLLGTVLGLIGAFAALGAADPAQKADLLSSGVSEAMNCTAFGLMVAIPALFLHAHMQSRTTRLIDSLESVCSRFVSAISGRPPAPTAAA